MRRFLLLFAAIAALSCSDGDSLSANHSIAGIWRFRFPAMTGAGSHADWSCELDAITFSVTQTGTTFSGVQLGEAFMYCSGGPEFMFAFITDGTLADGNHNGASATFELADLPGPHVGTYNGRRISGTATWTVGAGSDAFTVTGLFSAIRQ